MSCPRCNGSGWYRKNKTVFYCQCLNYEAKRLVLEKFPRGVTPDIEAGRKIPGDRLFIACLESQLNGLVGHVFLNWEKWESFRYILGFSIMDDYFTGGATISEDNRGPKLVVEMGGNEVPNKILGNVFMAFVRARAILQKQTVFLFRRPLLEVTNLYGKEVEAFLKDEVFWPFDTTTSNEVKKPEGSSIESKILGKVRL